MKTALITGVGGQDGTFLAEHLLNLGYRVYGIIRKSPKINFYLRNLSDKVEFLYGDMRDELSLRTALVKSWPDEVYNLAGQVFVPTSWQVPEMTFDVNVGGLTRLLKILEIEKKDTRVYQASSSEMYGNHEGACTEKTPMNPQSPYGVSKYAAHKLVGLYRQRGMYVVSGILFNHESPRRGDEMVTKKIAKAVAAWSMGAQNILSLGTLDSKRDWGYAGEYCIAMHLMLQQPEPDDYVIGTGESNSVRDFLEECLMAARLSWEFAEARMKIDDRLKRQQEIFDMKANGEKFAKQTGWKPKIGLRELARMMVAAERAKLRIVQKVEGV